MLSSGFTDTPITCSLVMHLIASSILASVLDIKYYFWIQISPHFWTYFQFWRVFTYQLCYANSGEVLFAAMTLYQLRCIERLWGSRKFASFLVIMYLCTSIIPPLLLALVLRPLSYNTLNYLPAGPTPLFFAILAQFHATIPHVYTYKLATSNVSAPADQVTGLTFSDKSFTYAIALQLSLCQFPGSLLGAVTGWCMGYLWRNEILPQSVVQWRVPGWVVKAPERGEGYEGLRRRLAGENVSATAPAAATGSDGRTHSPAVGERTVAQRVVDQFRGSRT